MAFSSEAIKSGVLPLHTTNTRGIFSFSDEASWLAYGLGSAIREASRKTIRAGKSSLEE